MVLGEKEENSVERENYEGGDKKVFGGDGTVPIVNRVVTVVSNGRHQQHPRYRSINFSSYLVYLLGQLESLFSSL